MGGRFCALLLAMAFLALCLGACAGNEVRVQPKGQMIIGGSVGG